VITPWLRQGESALVWAPSGIGKTMLTLTLALAVAGGGKVLGWEASKPRSVLLVDGEMHAADLRDRLRMLAKTVEGCDLEAASRNLKIICRQHQHGSVRFPDLAESEADDAAHTAGQDVILAAAKAAKAELLIADNLTTLAGIDDENSASAMAPVLRFLLRVKQSGLACVLVHHSDKGGKNFRGSSALATTFECIIGLHRLEGHSPGAGAGFELTWDKYRGRPTASTRDMEATLDGEVPEWTWKPAARFEMLSVLDAVRSGRFKNQRAVGTELGLAEYEVSRLKARAIGRGEISQEEWKACLQGDSGNRPKAAAESGNLDF
jgi:KaiC/GvpD/RAD55 family RecA-like ATPase